MNILQLAKKIKDENAQEVLDNPKDYPKDWVRKARKRLKQ